MHTLRLTSSMWGISQPDSPDRVGRSRVALSPLLFAPAIEPLAMLICSNPDVQSIEVAGYHHKLCLFADDILLFLTAPLMTMPNLFCILEQVTLVSGLAVNQQKSQALNLTLPSPDPLCFNLHFLLNGLPILFHTQVLSSLYTLHSYLPSDASPLNFIND